MTDKKIGDFLHIYEYVGFSRIPTYRKYKIIKITPKRYQVQAENNPNDIFYVNKENLKGVGRDIRLETEIPSEWKMRIKNYNRKKEVKAFIERLSKEISKLDVDSELFLKLESFMKEGV